MRAALLVATSLFALWQGRRDREILYYCLTFLVGTLAVEGWLWRGGADGDDWYHYIYFWAVFATTAVACWIGHRRKPQPVTALGCMSLAGATLANQPEQIMILQAAWLAIPAWQCWDSALGKLWAAQSVLFFAYAVGVRHSPAWWYWAGDWLPAALVVTAFTWVGLVENKAREHIGRAAGR